MFDIFTSSPSVGSLTAEPMEAVEIDTHPDCDRIWATINAARIDADQYVKDMLSDARHGQKKEDAASVAEWAKNLTKALDFAYENQSGVPAVIWLRGKIETASVDAL